MIMKAERLENKLFALALYIAVVDWYVKNSSSMLGDDVLLSTFHLLDSLKG